MLAETDIQEKKQKENKKEEIDNRKALEDVTTESSLCMFHNVRQLGRRCHDVILALSERLRHHYPETEIVAVDRESLVGPHQWEYAYDITGLNPVIPESWRC